MANSRSNIYPVKLQGAERFLIKRKKNENTNIGK